MTYQNQNKININAINAPEVVMISGTLRFARLISHIEGEELNRRNQADKAAGRKIFHERPFTTVTISNATVIPQSKNPQNLTLAEQYIQQIMYKSNAHPEYNWCLSVDDKGSKLPPILIQDGSGSYKQILPKYDLSAGQPVKVLVRIFNTKMGNGKGIGAVLVESTNPSYFGDSVSALTDELKLYNITYTPTEDTSTEYTPGSPEETQARENTALPPENIYQQPQPAYNDYQQTPQSNPYQQPPQTFNDPGIRADY